MGFESFNLDDLSSSTPVNPFVNDSSIMKV